MAKGSVPAALKAHQFKPKAATTKAAASKGGKTSKPAPKTSK